jgi:hypothetical protein
LDSEHADGRLYVWVNVGETGDETGVRDALIEELRAHNESLRSQLASEREANRENRRLLAAALERIPAIEAPPDTPPSEPREGPPSPSEGSVGVGPTNEERRSWLRRFFGL